MGAGLDGGGEVVRLTPTYGYVLPPPLPGRSWFPTFNGNSQYRLPDPVTGKITSYTRASTVAKALEDTYMLDAWAKRQMLMGMQRSLALSAELDQIMEHREAGTLTDNGLREMLNAVADEAQLVAGSKSAAEFGTAVHEWCEWVDVGQGAVADVPEQFRPWVAGHRQAMARSGLSPDPYYTERVVLNTRYGIAGTIDRIFACPDGVMRMGDIKTSRTMDFSWLYFSIQLAIYHGADFVRSIDGMAWEPMPVLDPHVALISHLPREDPDASHIVPINLAFGQEALHTAMTVRRLRSRAPKEVRSVRYAVSSEDTREHRRRTALGLLETCHTQADMAELWTEYQDIWTDDLTKTGLELLLLRQATQRNATR